MVLQVGHIECASANGHRTRGWGDVDKNLENLDLIVEVVKNRVNLLQAEDTDDDGQITIMDKGPKKFLLKSIDGQEAWITGSYQLGILLQELALARKAGMQTVRILGKCFTESPVDRLMRLIPEKYWTSLTRRLDVTTIGVAGPDGKVKGGDKLHIYVPAGAPEQVEYYENLSRDRPDFKLQVTRMPAATEVSQNLRHYRDTPGILALAMESKDTSLRGLSYTVPGYRFNEFYYWDSYFCCYGLLEAGKLDTVRGIVKHMIFQIDHYGCVLNGNRAYYLQRSQPPFLSDLVMRTYEKLVESGDNAAREFLREGITAAIKEYHHVWCCEPRLDPVTGLSRYRPKTAGVPPEVEEGHFDWFLAGIAEKHGLSIKKLQSEYNSGRLKDDEMDDFFRHDLAMRESGHDTSARLVDAAADLATVDLNALLYKYETDISHAIATHFSDTFPVHPGVMPTTHTDSTVKSAYFTLRAAARRTATDRHQWNAATGMWHDYNTVTQQQTPFKSVTTFWPLWAGLASPDQAERVIREIVPQFEHVGGMVSTLPLSRGEEGEGGGKEWLPRQWDYPYGWAPHQILVWDGLKRYGYEREARRLAYRWLFLLTRTFAEYCGRMTERYDVVQEEAVEDSDGAEYGNQGSKFEGVNIEGFGWTNSSYQYGLKIIGPELTEALRQGVIWEELEGGLG